MLFLEAKVRLGHQSGPERVSQALHCWGPWCHHDSAVTASVSWMGSGMRSGTTGLGVKEAALSRREQHHSALAGKLWVTADSEAAFT